MNLVTPIQMRALEEHSDKNRFSYEQLMENAGLCLARKIEEIYSKSTVNSKEIIFLCGNGNNGGDCFVATRYLIKQGYEVVIALLYGIPKTEISLNEFMKTKDKNLLIITEENQKIDIVKHATMVVDGVFGTGFHGELDDKTKNIFAVKTDAIKVAVDVPSGGNCATGAVSEGAFTADYTVCFAYKKFGMEQYPLKELCGKVMVVDIGIPESYYDTLDFLIKVIEKNVVSEIIPKRKADSHKGDFGRLLCITGSERMTGAGIMACESALRCGVGLVTVTSSIRTANSILTRIPEAMILPMETDGNGFYLAENLDKIIEECNKSSAVLIGCGLGVTDETKILVREVIKNISCPVILDADGINCIVDCIDIIKDNKSEVIITPHPAEFARIIGCRTEEVQSDRLASAVGFTRESKAILVLKGAGTIVAVSDKAYVNINGNSGMSKGGSGDILSGMIASFVAQGIKPEQSAILSVYMHGRAGDLTAVKYSQQAMLPTDMVQELPYLFNEMKNNK